MPVTRIDGIGGIGNAVIGQQNILVCASNPRRDSQADPSNGFFGLLIDGNPELKIVKSINDCKNSGKPFINKIGQFDDEQTQIMSTRDFRVCMENQLAVTCDTLEKITFKTMPRIPILSKDLSMQLTTHIEQIKKKSERINKQKKQPKTIHFPEEDIH